MASARPGRTLTIDGRPVLIEEPELILRTEEGRVVMDLYAETAKGESGLMLDGLPLPGITLPGAALGTTMSLDATEVPELADAVVTLDDQPMVIDEVTLILGQPSEDTVTVQLRGSASVWGGRTGIPFEADLACALELHSPQGAHARTSSAD